MPHAVYLPSVAVLSFLRRTLRTPLSSSQTSACTPRTTLQPLHHVPTVLCRFPQCRALHLYKTAKSKTILGQHKILSFERYNITRPCVSHHKINLWTEPGGEQIAEGLSLEQVYRKYVKPGHMLYLTQQMKKSHSEDVDYLRDNNVQNEFNNYAIVKCGSTNIHIAKHKKINDPSRIIRDFAGLKEIHVNLASPASYWQLSLLRAHAFLDAGHKVEFSMRLKGSFVGKTSRQKPGDPKSWPWIHKNFPHLRPDFILKSMPKGTYYMIDPFSDGKHVQFVLAMSHKRRNLPNLRRSFTKQALKMKHKVKLSIASGTQNELPRVIRKALIAEGKDMYSLDTGTARHSEADMISGKSEVRWGEESLELIPRSVLRARIKEGKKLKKQLKTRANALKYRQYYGGGPLVWTALEPTEQSQSSFGREADKVPEPRNDNWQLRDTKQVNGRSTLSSASSRGEDGMGTSDQSYLPLNDRFMVPRGKDRRRLEAESRYATPRDAEGQVYRNSSRRSQDTVRVY